MPIDTPAWVRDAVFYQIFPDRFASSERVRKPGPLEPWDSPPTIHGFKGGDLLGIAEHLDELQELGITALYLNPIFSSASNHRYHTFDYMQVDPLLGGDAALRELIDAAHARGMKVVLDGVFNHASRGFWPFHHVLETGASSPYRSWFYLDDEALDAGRPLDAYPEARAQGEREASVLPERRGEESVRALGYRAWWGLPALPKLNTDDPNVREYIFQVAEHWLRFGADGWRLDVPAEIDDDEFWREFRRRVRAVDPEAYICAEIWYEDPRWLQGDQFDSYMNYPLALAILGFVAQGHLHQHAIHEQSNYSREYRPLDGAGFVARLEHLSRNYDPAVVAVQLNLLDSHDTPRFLTLCSGDRAAYRLAVLTLMTYPGAPCIYYGDEIGMEGHHDPDCRRSFPWDRERWDVSLRDFVMDATALRHANSALRVGTFRVLASDGLAVAYERADAAATFVVALNAAEHAMEIAVPLTADCAERRLVPLLSTSGEPPAGFVGVAADGNARIPVAARSGLVLRVE